MTTRTCFPRSTIAGDLFSWHKSVLQGNKRLSGDNLRSVRQVL